MPPASPVPGQCWIVGASPSGAWAGQADTLAAWTDGGWRFVAPTAGLTVWLESDSVPMIYDGTLWTTGVVHARSVAIGGVQVVGARQPAVPLPTGGTAPDAEARSALSRVIAALVAHGLLAAQ